MPNIINTCFYCNTIGHTPTTCYTRKFGVTNGKYVWVEKGINLKGPDDPGSFCYFRVFLVVFLYNFVSIHVVFMHCLWF